MKILGSTLVPVFLFMSVPQAIADQPAAEIAVTFQIKDESLNESVLSRYQLSATPLFQNIFKAKIASDIMEQMEQDKDLVYIENDSEVKAFAVTTNDAFFTVDSKLEDRQWYLPKTRVNDAWDFTKGKDTVTVAIVDTGIHGAHIELSDGRIVDGFNTITNQPILASANSDDNGHGTAVAGVIGAVPNNAKGLAGINWNIRLMPIKALSADGTGELSAVAAGIVWAADHSANIINLSLGGPGYGSDRTLSNAITYAYNKGVLIVAAAGNDLADHGTNLDSAPVYPVCGDNGQDMVLGVAATDVNDQKASFSNFGASCIDISAPGKKIITTAYLPSEPDNNILIYASGTSLATPIVSGIAALMKANDPNLSNTDIRNKIEKSADNIYPANQFSCLGTSCNGFLGGGRINAYAAMAPTPVAIGSMIREVSTGNIYIITNTNTKRLVPNFVFTQRGFKLSDVMNEQNNQLTSIPSTTPLTPLEGTLVKNPIDAQVYIIEGEMKRPLTYLVFITRGLNFANIKTVTQGEVDLYPLGEWAQPQNGVMVLISGDPTVYVMDASVVRPVTFFVFQQRRLSFAKVLRVTPDEFSHIQKPGDTFWLSPMDGTLLKSASDPAIYVIESGAKRLLSYEAFVARNYKFANVKVLPQAEMDVITPGLPLLSS